MFSPETIARLDYLRSEALKRDLSMEEQSEVIRLIRGERKQAADISSKARTPKASGAEVLAKLQAMMKPVVKP